MKKYSLSKNAGLIIIIFIISRIALTFFDISLDYTAIFRNWQYLDVYTLQHNLLRGVWYDHTQPPVFNLFLGLVLKLTGSYAPIAFSLIFKLFTLVNTLLLYCILKKTIQHTYIPIILALLYLLSPASIIFENELFYTSFISFWFLLSCYFLLGFREKINWKNSGGFFLCLLVISLTRSMYHIAWQLILSIIVLIYYRKEIGLSKLVAASLIAILLTGSWYVKNYIIFNTFSTSTWAGMNIARNVFHDAPITDSSRIETIEPFSKISAYKSYIPAGYENKYAGLNDRDLLLEMKNDSFINEKHVGYIEVSNKYMAAIKQEIKSHPLGYIKNVVQSGITFFAPATRYPTTEYQAKKIKYYDVLYSFNISHFASGKQQRRIALTVSAFPKFIIYLLVFFLVVRDMIRKRRINILHFFILAIILYIFFISSFFEHYENMRFRYEAEPLFLVLAAFAIDFFLKNRKKVRDVKTA
ncbi:MAG: hypothetical protein WDN26_00170 [Chitinophagaceae bacterium]